MSNKRYYLQLMFPLFSTMLCRWTVWVYQYKHFIKQKKYKPCRMRIISSRWRSWATWSGFLKSSVVMCCRISGNKVVTFYWRQRLARVFPSMFPWLARKAANLVEIRLCNALLSSFVFSKHFGRLRAKAKTIWIVWIC